LGRFGSEGGGLEEFGRAIDTRNGFAAPPVVCGRKPPVNPPPSPPLPSKLALLGWVALRAPTAEVC
jgi:hypothetical protein